MLALERLDLLLLRAALLDAGPARAAWHELADGFDLDTLDHGRMRLLPLLHHNLLRLGVEDQRLARLRGVRHYHWARNQVRLRSLVPLLGALGAAGVGVLLLKGAALLAGTLPDFSLRPMDDVDLLVRPEQISTVLPILAARGYRPVNVHPWTIPAVLMQEAPGYPFANAAGDQIDLHWHALHLDQRPLADLEFWRAARPGRLFGAPVTLPAPADLLLHVCAHAGGWNVTHGLRWACDATVILRAAGPDFDWDRLLAQSREHRLEATILPHLATLRQHLDLAVPPAVLRSLRRRTTPLSRLHARLAQLAPMEQRPWQRRFLAIETFRRSRDHLMHRTWLRALPSYLRQVCPADSRAAWLPLLAFQTLGRPAWLRRRLPIDSRLRRPDAAKLPPLGSSLAADAPPALRAAFLEGWSYFEHRGRWTLGGEARLGWRLAGEASDTILTLDGWILRPRGGLAPRVEIWTAGRRLASFTAPPEGQRQDILQRVTIPAALLRGAPALVVTLVVRDPIVPMHRGLGSDLRPLGFFLRRAQATKA